MSGPIELDLPHNAKRRTRNLLLRFPQKQISDRRCAAYGITTRLL